ncbi:MAG: PEP-CTERM sorting domain-containing protein [Gammaproteobacteria bacterium]|jgi:hypothetical protein|nr:PEP-CTERM sorting domain-containing protein [Gammaproteobacteria bacterium]MBU0771147.1 PEP-CTERM sorting domain-containing protein [Gammaproteobacteria bacterium]MBU0855832.1 PEP-CTERM sorting domain-containing protein [Gammaproteobacteria bacterium]MBU1849040.1 PEP-CTERM sorting domain-containing protein [Gammaproteobacteria bacterium]
MSFHHLCTTGALCLLASTSAFATSAAWDTPLAGYSGDGTSSAAPWASGAAYAEWNVFDSASSDATPDIAGSGTLSQTSPGAGAFLTGSGNIYSAGGGAAFSIDLVSSLTGSYDIWLRVATQGTAADSVATLNGIAATKQVSFSAVLGGFGGSEEEAYWHWTVSSPLALQFSFGSSEAHMSLDQLAVLAAPVPEPATWLSLAAGLGVIGALARRRA